MSAWMTWAVLAGVVVILELFSGTFYLLMISLGMIAGALSALIGFGTSVQLIVAGIVGSVATIALHSSKYGWKGNVDAARDPNVNMDIGQIIEVPQWNEQGNGNFTARASYRGAMWDVEMHHGSGEPGQYVIQEVQGSKLIVKLSTR
ncbi:NfeD family protein [Undibacterium jejuense]|uniref:NfeD family protein n=1 Tax=Undibacterium jejuense TaxID=1344949 RepID=A0A923HCZ1_9BURK|nr:NfeD family protein [Undibacterium jejuense]MBC3860755.1 NfeD family protein [Undibacterium jejuense]